MIDRKTREKIIKLWKDGESKTSIKKKTGVSLPTIRKVIKEAGSEKEPSTNNVKPQPIEFKDLEERLLNVEEAIERHEGWWSEVPTSTKLIINLTRNWPYGSNPPLECLKNGVPIYDLERLLGKILPLKPVKFIIKEIKKHRGSGNVLSGTMYEVRISRGSWGIEDISVQPLVFSDMLP